MRMRNNHIQEDGTIAFASFNNCELNDITLSRDEVHPAISFMLFVHVKTKKLSVPITIENGSLKE